MPSRGYAVERMLHDPVSIDYEGGTQHAHSAHAVGFAKLPDTVLAADLAIGIGQQPHRQAMLVAKLGVRDAVVAADPEHRAVEPAEFGLEIAELGGFDNATRRVVLDIEVEHERLPAEQCAQLEHVHVRVGQRKIRCDLAGLDHVVSFESQRF